MSEAKSHFDRVGGIVQDIIGVRETWAQFSEGLTGLGRALHSFGNIMNYGVDFKYYNNTTPDYDRVKMDFEGLKVGIEAIADLAIAKDDLDRVDGLVQWIIGKKETWSSFGAGLSGLGEELVKFGNHFENYNTENITTGITALQGLIGINKDLNSAVTWTSSRNIISITDQADLWMKFIDGVAYINDEKLQAFFKTMSSVHEWAKSQNIDPEDVVKEFETFVNVLNSTMTLFAEDSFDGTSTDPIFNDGSKFEKRMEHLGTGIGYITSGLQEFYGMLYGKNIMGIADVNKGIDLNKLTAAISIMKSIVSVVDQFDDTMLADADGKAQDLEEASLHMRAAFANFQWEDSIDFDLIEKTLTNFTKGFEHLKSRDFWNESVDAVEAVGAKFVEYVGIGMRGAYLKYIVPAFRSIVESATVAMGVADTTQVAPTNEYVKKFQIVGEHFAYGLRYGMNSKTGEIVKSVENMSETMVKALREKLKIESPSKVTKEIGKYFDEGLAIGIEDNIDPAIESVEYLGDSIIYTFEEVEAETRSFGSSFEEFYRIQLIRL